LVYKCNWWWAA